MSRGGWTRPPGRRYASPVSRRDLWEARERAGLRIDFLVAEAWSAHVREQLTEARRAQQARRQEANRQELLGILAEMRRRGWRTR